MVHSYSSVQTAIKFMKKSHEDLERRFANIYKFCNSTINPLSANFTKWSNTLKQFVDNLPTNCLNVFDHFVGFALKGLKNVF